MYHQCWIEFLDKWAERTKDAILLPWADGVTRSTRLFIGGVLGDQQEGDKYTGEPCVCHRCFAPRKRYLETADSEAKTMRKVRMRVELAAAGGYLKGRHNSTRVVKWDPDGRNVRPGPGFGSGSLGLCAGQAPKFEKHFQSSPPQSVAAQRAANPAPWPAAAASTPASAPATPAARPGLKYTKRSDFRGED